MARTQKFPEDLLLEAVVKYAEVEKGKIKATELAAWAASNIKGLEGVRDYHFMRPVRNKDSKHGKCQKKYSPEGIHDRSVYGSAGLCAAPPDR